METSDLVTREIRDIAETTMIIGGGVAHRTETGGMRGTAGTLETRGERVRETDPPGERVEMIGTGTPRVTDLRPEKTDASLVQLVRIINSLPTEILPSRLRPRLLQQPLMAELPKPTKSIKSGKLVKLYSVRNDV